MVDNFKKIYYNSIIIDKNNRVNLITLLVQLAILQNKENLLEL